MLTQTLHPWYLNKGVINIMSNKEVIHIFIVFICGRHWLDTHQPGPTKKTTSPKFLPSYIGAVWWILSTEMSWDYGMSYMPLPSLTKKNLIQIFHTPEK